jgi:hypothetical protein
MPNATLGNEGLLMITDQDPGSNLGWTIAAKVYGMLPGESDSLGFSKICVVGDDLYVCYSNDLDTQPDEDMGPIVWHATIHRGAYIPFGDLVATGAHFNFRI